MMFRKLPSNSEKILLDLVAAENASQTLITLYEECSERDRMELDGVVRELKEYGYIDVKWADNKPYIVILHNCARTYSENLAKHKIRKDEKILKEMKKNVFISHRSTDKAIADMLVDFFSATSIPKEAIFCSSLPGNDINEKISDEVKSALKNSVVNIAILSHNYYQSAYCLNEAGILWYEDTPVIPIALPEIDSNNMYGFLNNEYKIRRLDCDTDVSYVYDVISDAVEAPHVKNSVITHENNKLRERYKDYLEGRKPIAQVSAIQNTISFSEITTDDERIVLYYLLTKSVRKVSKAVILKWLNESEIHNVNIDNAFDLLSSFDGGAVSDDVLEFGIDAFRNYSAKSETIIPELKKSVDRHTKLAGDVFKNLWRNNGFDSIIKLFVVYIVEERMQTFGNRWMAEGQIENIKEWETKNILDSTLSKNYGSCLEFFIQKDFVYESSWTSNGNPREYTLAPSLREVLFNCPTEINEKLQDVKNENYLDIPF